MRVRDCSPSIPCRSKPSENEDRAELGSLGVTRAVPESWGPGGEAVLGVTHRPKARRNTFSLMWEVTLPTQSGKQSLPRAILVSSEPALCHSGTPPRSPHSCTWQGGLVAVLGGHWPQQVPVSGLLWGSQRCLLSPLCHLCPGSSWSSILVPKAQRGLAPTGDKGIALRSPHSPLPLTRERQRLRSLEQEGGHGDTPRAAALL